ncbi:MAG: glutathione S-transferase family protein [Betaproteobacteria bacterium]|nr:MAG: glutathione S-transferase family protein [Betaproteobacteria bacterium]
MIDLYAAGTSNGLRARMALEECGLAYKLNPIALDKGEHKTPQFLALNPNAQIPVIVDHEGPGGKPLTLAQSTAILVYCAEKSGKFMPRDGAARAAMWEALMSASTDVTPTFGSINAVLRSEEPHAPSAELFKERWKQYLKVWDDRLARQKYCAGNEMTIADISLYGIYARAKAAAAQLCEGFPSVARWAGEMAARPAMQRAVKF